jgi:hypothetical protein
MRRPLALIPFLAARSFPIELAPSLVAFVVRAMGQHRPFRAIRARFFVRRFSARSFHPTIVAGSAWMGWLAGAASSCEASILLIGGNVMDNEEKPTDKTGQFTSKANKLGEQAKEKATSIAGEVAHRAGPLAEQAKTKATELAHKAGPMAAHGVETTANKLDELTHGKYSDRIKSVTSSLERLLDPAHYGGNGTSDAAATSTGSPAPAPSASGDGGSAPAAEPASDTPPAGEAPPQKPAGSEGS